MPYFAPLIHMVLLFGLLSLEGARLVLIIYEIIREDFDLSSAVIAKSGYSRVYRSDKPSCRFITTVKIVGDNSQNYNKPSRRAHKTNSEILP